MEELIDLKIIIGFLSGSLGTLFIKEIFNQINRKVDFNRELRKMTFTRKLEKAEKAVAFYSSYLNTLIEMKKSFEVIITTLKNDRELDLSIIQEILKQHNSNLTDLMKNSYPESTAVNLYFELEDLEKWNENDISEFLENLAETKSKDNDILFWLNIYNSHLDKEENDKADLYWNKVEKILPSYLKSLEKVVQSLEKNRIASYAIIKEQL